MITNADVMRELRARAYAESLALRAQLDPPAPIERDTVTHYTIAIHGCPRCGGPLHHLANSAPHTATFSIQTRVVAECRACQDLIPITVTMGSERHARRRRESLEADTCLNPHAPRRHPHLKATA